MTEQEENAFEKWYKESGLIDKDEAYDTWEACCKYHAGDYK